jgi:hypothetical protein
LKDLLYHNEGTQDFIEEDIIDMQKLDVMGKMIEDFRRTQVRRREKGGRSESGTKTARRRTEDKANEMPKFLRY